jgi:aminobenzoyl-glutamate utilization protein B
MMKPTIALAAAILLLASGAPAQKKGSLPDNPAIRYLDRSFAKYDSLQKEIWRYAELGFLETSSSGALQQHLAQNGFTVNAALAGMPTAFVAAYGTGSPVIGIIAEFDALPGLSQDTVPYRQALTNGGSGHGCGHNAFGTGAVAAAVALQRWLAQNHGQGTVKVFGTPAEEGGGGKIYMLRDGLFSGVDVVLAWHPDDHNAIMVDTWTAVQMLDYSFHGIAAHAAGSPDKGRSALDGVEAFSHMVNLMREHVPTSSRIHYVIVNGGEAPNIVPDFAKVSYYLRSPDRKVLGDLIEWVGQAAQGAALGTQTTVTVDTIAGFYELLNNRTLATLAQQKLELVGGVHYSERERVFAKAIAAGFGQDEATLQRAQAVLPLRSESAAPGGPSTDVGDISWNFPTVTINTAVFIPGSAGHSWQNVAAGGTTIATKALLNAAKVIALTAIDLYQNPRLLGEVKAEFNHRRGDSFRYVPLLGGRAPALDYRVKKN